MNPSKGRRTLVLLTLNERQGVEALIPQLPRDVADEIVAVDGGSSDGTVDFLEKNNIRVIRQKSRGRGAAFREGVDGTQGELLVFFSPDGNEAISDIIKLFERLEAGADMAIASRFLPDSVNEEDDSALPLRKWTNQAFTWMANTLWNRGRYISDTINGFRGLHRSTFAALQITSPRFTIEYEMSIHAMKARLQVEEIPTVEGHRIGGETKAPSFKTGIAFVRFLLSELFTCPFPKASR